MYKIVIYNYDEAAYREHTAGVEPSTLFSPDAGLCIYDDGSIWDHDRVIDPVLNLKDNAAGTLEFTMPSQNYGYGSITRMVTLVAVLRGEETIWRGRVLSEEEDFYRRKKYYCEGALSFLTDTLQPPKTYTPTDFTSLLRELITIHNDKIKDTAPHKQFTIGTITVNNNVFFYGIRETQTFITGYKSTLETITELVKLVKGHMRVRYENGVQYLDIFQDWNSNCTQKINFGENLLDYTQKFDSSELCTVLLPVGKDDKGKKTKAKGSPIDLGLLQAGGVLVKQIDGVRLLSMSQFQVKTYTGITGGVKYRITSKLPKDMTQFYFLDEFGNGLQSSKSDGVLLNNSEVSAPKNAVTMVICSYVDDAQANVELSPGQTYKEPYTYYDDDTNKWVTRQIDKDRTFEPTITTRYGCVLNDRGWISDLNGKLVSTGWMSTTAGTKYFYSGQMDYPFGMICVIDDQGTDLVWEVGKQCYDDTHHHTESDKQIEVPEKGTKICFAGMVNSQVAPLEVCEYNKAYDEIDNHMTIKDATGHDGTEFLVNQELLQKYGWIEKIVEFDDVLTPDELLTKARQYLQGELNDHVYNKIEINVKALDLKYLDATTDSFDLYDLVTCVSAPHGLNRHFPVREISLPLNKPDSVEYTIGDSLESTITATTLDADSKLLEEIKKKPSMESVVVAAREHATSIMKQQTLGHTAMVETEQWGGTFFITDTENYQDATRMWVWNLNGLGYSKNGGRTFDTAITMDGSIVADFITAGTMQADRVRTGLLTDVNGLNYWDLTNSKFRLGYNTEVKDKDGKEMKITNYIFEEMFGIEPDDYKRASGIVGDYDDKGRYRLYISADVIYGGILHSLSGGFHFDLNRGALYNTGKYTPEDPKTGDAVDRYIEFRTSLIEGYVGGKWVSPTYDENDNLELDEDGVPKYGGISGGRRSGYLNLAATGMKQNTTTGLYEEQSGSVDVVLASAKNMRISYTDALMFEHGDIDDEANRHIVMKMGDGKISIGRINAYTEGTRSTSDSENNTDEKKYKKYQDELTVYGNMKVYGKIWSELGDDGFETDGNGNSNVTVDRLRVRHNIKIGWDVPDNGRFGAAAWYMSEDEALAKEKAAASLPTGDDTGDDGGDDGGDDPYIDPDDPNWDDIDPDDIDWDDIDPDLDPDDIPTVYADDPGGIGGPDNSGSGSGSSDDPLIITPDDDPVIIDPGDDSGSDSGSGSVSPTNPANVTSGPYGPLWDDQVNDCIVNAAHWYHNGIVEFTGGEVAITGSRLYVLPANGYSTEMVPNDAEEYRGMMAASREIFGSGKLIPYDRYRMILEGNALVLGELNASLSEVRGKKFTTWEPNFVYINNDIEMVYGESTDKARLERTSYIERGSAWFGRTLYLCSWDATNTYLANGDMTPNTRLWLDGNAYLAGTIKLGGDSQLQYVGSNTLHGFKIDASLPETANARKITLCAPSTYVTQQLIVGLDPSTQTKIHDSDANFYAITAYGKASFDGDVSVGSNTDNHRYNLAVYGELRPYQLISYRGSDTTYGLRITASNAGTNAKKISLLSTTYVGHHVSDSDNSLNEHCDLEVWGNTRLRLGAIVGRYNTASSRHAGDLTVHGNLKVYGTVTLCEETLETENTNGMVKSSNSEVIDSVTAKTMTFTARSRFEKNVYICGLNSDGSLRSGTSEPDLYVGGSIRGHSLTVNDKASIASSGAITGYSLSVNSNASISSSGGISGNSLSINGNASISSGGSISGNSITINDNAGIASSGAITGYSLTLKNSSGTTTSSITSTGSANFNSLTINGTYASVTSSGVADFASLKIAGITTIDSGGDAYLGSVKIGSTTRLLSDGSGNLASLKIGGTVTIDSDRNATLTSVKIGNTTRIASDGVGNFSSLKIGGTEFVDSSRNLYHLGYVDATGGYINSNDTPVGGNIYTRGFAIYNTSRSKTAYMTAGGFLRLKGLDVSGKMKLDAFGIPSNDPYDLQEGDLRGRNLYLYSTSEETPVASIRTTGAITGTSLSVTSVSADMLNAISATLTGTITAQDFYFKGGNIGVTGDRFMSKYGAVLGWDGNNYATNVYGPLAVSGSLQVNGQTVTGSDERLKKNISEMDFDALDMVNSVKVKSFDWKKTGQHIPYGFIAQDVEKADKHNGLTTTDGDGYKAIDYNELTAVLWKAVQELSAEVSRLKELVKEAKP